MIRLMKSDCEKAWLFDVKKEDNILRVGFACFLAQCPQQLLFSMGRDKVTVLTPHKATASPMPTRIVNARLSMLSNLP
jgi:hypothetical protein